MLNGLRQDLHHAVRLIRRQPGFAAVAIATVALAIAATTVLFSLTYGVLMRPLPWPDSDRLVRITESRAGKEPRIRGTISNGPFIAWQDAPTTIEAIGGWRNVPATVIIGGGDPVRLQTAAVTPSLFAVLKARPLHGRLFVNDDGPAGGSFASREVVILSFAFWQERFGGADNAVGATLTINDRPYEIVGVMPRDFAFPDRTTRAWTPWAVPSVVGNQGVRRVTIFSALARLRDGATPEQATAEGTARAATAPDPGLAAVAMFGDSGAPRLTAVAAVDLMTAEVRPALLIMLAAVMLLLLTATANVAGVQLARATARRREMAIRAAIGAGAARLTRQLALESLVVGLAGGVVGIGCAAGVIRLLPRLLPADFPRVDDVSLDAGVLALSLGLSLMVGLACGLLPALHTRRVGVTEALADGAAAAAGGFLRTPSMRARSVIMVAELAVACVLLIGAALLGRSFTALLASDRGYDPRNLLTARMSLPPAFTLEQRRALLATIVSRMEAAPGVRHAAFGNALPLLTSGGYRAFKMRPPIDPSTEVEVNAAQRVVSPGYFAALGLRLSEGRTLTEADVMTSQQVVVVNRSFATRYLGPHPLGTLIPNLGMCRGDDDRWTVVGVVDDMRQGDVTDAPQPEVFMAAAQVGCPTTLADAILVVRTNDEPGAHVPTLRDVVRHEAPNLALDSVMSMDERVLSTLARPRLYALVLIAFAVFAATIGAVGLFGVLSYSVAQRTREIGVRAALGATPSQIVRLIVRQGIVISVVGVAAGTWAAFAASRWLTTVLYGVDAHDPVTFVVVPLLLVGVAAVACVVPARRAVHIDPLTALRAE